MRKSPGETVLSAKGTRCWYFKWRTSVQILEPQPCSPHFSSPLSLWAHDYGLSGQWLCRPGLGLHNLIQSRPLPPYQERMGCFVSFHFIFFDKAYIFNSQFWLWAIWKQLCMHGRGEGSPCRYTLCFMAELLPKQSWTQRPTNYFSFKLIFPVSSVY